MRSAQLTTQIAAVLTLAFTLSACTSESITFIDEGNAYTRASALRLTESTSSGKLEEQQTADSKVLRDEALASLRTRGDTASEAATLITKILPAESRSVPFYVERASFEGTTAILMIEALGPADGTLADKRLWVLSSQGDVLLSGSR